MSFDQAAMEPLVTEFNANESTTYITYGVFQQKHNIKQGGILIIDEIL